MDSMVIISTMVPEVASLLSTLVFTHGCQTASSTIVLKWLYEPTDAISYLLVVRKKIGRSVVSIRIATLL